MKSLQYIKLDKMTKLRHMIKFWWCHILFFAHLAVHKIFFQYFDQCPSLDIMQYQLQVHFGR